MLKILNQCYWQLLFSQVFFLILALIVVSFAPLGDENGQFVSPVSGFVVGLFVYLILLGLIYLQCVVFKKRFRRYYYGITNLVCLEIILFLTLFHFILAGHRLFSDSLTLTTLCSLGFYYFALFAYYRTCFESIPYTIKGPVTSSYKYACTKLRLLAPFPIPFLLFSLFMDFSTQMNPYFIGFGTLALLILILLFFPPVLQAIWNCQPIKDHETLLRLENLCRRAHFKHAGIRTWNVMNHTYTAGIVGILPRFRYIMFTQRLLDEMPPYCVDAILVHEIGHNYRRHLLIYPLIILGMIASTALFSLFFSQSIDLYFILNEHFYPSPFWDIFYPFAVFIPYAIIIALYFRFVFGYFSRLFERQADLHAFEVGIPPEDMRDALDWIGQMTGNSHHHPSWHHHSIHERMKFLDEASQDFNVAVKHHRKTRRALFVYALILTAAIILLFSPLLPNFPVFRSLNQSIQNTNEQISKWFNADLLNRIERSHNHE